MGRHTRTGHTRTGPDRTGPDRTSPDRTSPDRTSPDRTSPDRTGPDRIGADTIAALPGWGLFASAVAAATLRWSGSTWGSTGAVTALGVATTAALWWSACRVE
jgi:hypothetical protein